MWQEKCLMRLICMLTLVMILSPVTTAKKDAINKELTNEKCVTIIETYTTTPDRGGTVKEQIEKDQENILAQTYSIPIRGAFKPKHAMSLVSNVPMRMIFAEAKDLSTVNTKRQLGRELFKAKSKLAKVIKQYKVGKVSLQAVKTAAVLYQATFEGLQRVVQKNFKNPEGCDRIFKSRIKHLKNEFRDVLNLI